MRVKRTVKLISSLGARILTGPFYLQLLIFLKYVCLLCITVWTAPGFNAHLPFTRLLALYSFFYFLELLLSSSLLRQNHFYTEGLKRLRRRQIKQPLSINLEAKLPMIPADITVRTVEKRTSIKWATFLNSHLSLPLVRPFRCKLKYCLPLYLFCLLVA